MTTKTSLRFHSILPHKIAHIVHIDGVTWTDKLKINFKKCGRCYSIINFTGLDDMKLWFWCYFGRMSMIFIISVIVVPCESRMFSFNEQLTTFYVKLCPKISATSTLNLPKKTLLTLLILHSQHLILPLRNRKIFFIIKKNKFLESFFDLSYKQLN